MLSSCKTQDKLVVKTNPDVEYLIHGKFKLIEVDKLGFTYLVNKKNEVMKYDADFNLLFRYSVRSLGDATSINVNNPQKIFIYYADYTQIVLLDNTLSEIKRLDLEDLELHNISGATVARDNFIWLFDNSNLRLLKINENGKIFLSSNEQDPTLRAFVDETPEIFAYENQIYLNNGNQLAIYDEFGVHLKNISVISERLKFDNNKLIYKNGRKINSRNLIVDFLKETNITELKEIREDVINFHLNNDTLLLVDTYGLYQAE